MPAIGGSGEKYAVLSANHVDMNATDDFKNAFRIIDAAGNLGVFGPTKIWSPPGVAHVAIVVAVLIRHFEGAMALVTLELDWRLKIGVADDTSVQGDVGPAICGEVRTVTEKLEEFRYSSDFKVRFALEPHPWELLHVVKVFRADFVPPDAIYSHAVPLKLSTSRMLPGNCVFTNCVGTTCNMLITTLCIYSHREICT